MILHSDNQQIFVGGGNSIGLLIGEDFLMGRTKCCETFGNELLCKTEEFKIVDFEAFGFSAEKLF